MPYPSLATLLIVSIALIRITAHLVSLAGLRLMGLVRHRNIVLHNASLVLPSTSVSNVRKKEWLLMNHLVLVATLAR